MTARRHPEVKRIGIGISKSKHLTVKRCGEAGEDTHTVAVWPQRHGVVGVEWSFNLGSGHTPGTQTRSR